jgi:hypothetical protein
MPKSIPEGFCETKIYKRITITRDSNGYLVENEDGTYTSIGDCWADAKDYLNTVKPDELGMWPLDLRTRF